ncbi:hypothetical protein OGAPHI_004761 [Ogataea philodendri]|uniref:pH-response regulator protein palF/RIM8 n=1 Tax=Ogataea philodendri TaxID=1378263 RepID=A0A9P8P396_9ASCO|nr:uncharacterized protein OGAPHI_004761 [Ogataea philodendri]KAH3664047.1 hypothetical protein OGAPHI_004761 [Ogataea philodendri]
MLDNPHKLYRPGEELSGQVILILKKNVVGLKISLSLEGCIKITSTSPLRSDKKQNLFDHNIVLYGDAEDSALTLGEHRFPFIIKLPKRNVHTSISFEKGEIKYMLKCTIIESDSADGILASCEKLFSIVKPINLMLLPEPQPKVLNFKTVKHGLYKTLSSVSSASSLNSANSIDDNSNNRVQVKMNISSMGYLRGDSVNVRLSLKCYKKIANTQGIIVTLIRICRLDLGQGYEIQSYRKDLSQSIVPLIMDPSTLTCETSTSLKVPVDCFPTITTNLVSFQYYVEVLVNLSNSKIQAPSDHKFVDDEIIHTDTSSNIYNVDRLKRTKNVLTLNSEIIIGTERRVSSRLRKKAERSASAPQTPCTSIDSPLSTQDSTPPAPTPTLQYTTIPESSSTLTEKELLRLREQALLPSEPPQELIEQIEQTELAEDDYDHPPPELPPFPTPAPSDVNAMHNILNDDTEYAAVPVYSGPQDRSPPR